MGAYGSCGGLFGVRSVCSGFVRVSFGGGAGEGLRRSGRGRGRWRSGRCVRFGRSGAVWVPHVCTKVPAEVTGGSRRPIAGRSGARGAERERNRTQGVNAGAAGGHGAVRSPRLPTASSRVNASERRGKT